MSVFAPATALSRREAIAPEFPSPGPPWIVRDAVRTGTGGVMGRPAAIDEGPPAAALAIPFDAKIIRICPSAAQPNIT